MWIVGIIAVALFAWWWAAQQRASQRLKMRVAIRTGVRVAFERWRSPDNDQILEAIYEAARPTPLSLAQLDALVRPGLSQIVAELEEDGTIESGDSSPKEKPKRVATPKPSASNEANAERLQAQSTRPIQSGDSSPKEEPKRFATPKPSASNEADAKRLQAELARSMMTLAAMATFKALLVDQEVGDGAIEEHVYKALRANLGSSDSATSRGLSAALTREKARSWGSAVAHFYRTRAATAVAVVANKDPQAPSKMSSPSQSCR